MKAVVVGNGRLPPPGGLPDDLLVDAGLVVGVDGGALKALSLALTPDLVIGDGDSLDEATVERLAMRGVAVRLAPTEKDESDMELGVRHALEAGARRLVLLGALGGCRIEHTLANLALLALPELDACDVCVVDDRSSIRLLAAIGGPRSLTIEGDPADFVSLLPFGGDAEGVTTDGLRYPLHEEPLFVGPSRGLSNELTGTSATVRLARGRLLVVHTRRDALTRTRDEPGSADNVRANAGVAVSVHEVPMPERSDR